MTYLSLSLIIFSALMHSLYNFMFKQSRDKILFLWSMFSVSILIMTVIGAMCGKHYIYPDVTILTLSAASALFFTLYQLYTGKSYSLSGGDLSLTYPLSITGPVYIPFLAFIFIGEKISAITFLGILTAMLGAYAIQLNTSLRNFKIGKIDLSKKYIRYAAFAGFIYSFGAVIDKVGVGNDKFFLYTYWVIIFMFIYMSINILLKRDLRNKIFKCYKNVPFKVLLSAVLLTLSFLSYRYAMQTTSISATAGARQVSSLFGVLMGIFILRESYGAVRFIATLFIVIGIVLIKIG